MHSARNRAKRKVMNLMPDEMAVQPEPEQVAAIAVPESLPPGQSIWNNPKLMNQAWKIATMLAKSSLLPEATYYNRPENVLICMELAERMDMPLLMVAQNLSIVKGNPSWRGSFCAALIERTGKFTPLKYISVEDGGGGCFARATRVSTGDVCQSETITMQMAADEGWLGKTGSKWKTMPQQMMKYRAAAFFARVYCPEALFGMQTVEEVQDVHGYEDKAKPTVTIKLD